MLHQPFLRALSLWRAGLTAVEQETEQLSVIEEVWQFLYDRYFNIDLAQYKNLDFGTGKLVSVPGMIFGLIIGAVVAAGFASYDKNRLGGFVRKLIKSDCLSSERAKTLEELGYGGAKGLGIRSSLKHGTVLRRAVRCVERDAYEADRAEALRVYREKTGSEKGFDYPLFVLDFETARFYIPDEEHYATDIRFDHNGSGWRAYLLCIMIALACLALAFFFLPEMLQMLDNMIGIFKSE